MSNKLPLPEAGTTFGNFVVVDGTLHPTPKGKQGQHILVECDKCGADSVYSISYLTGYKFSKTSKCKHCFNSTKYKGLHSLSGYYFNQIKRGAKARNLEFNVDLQFLWKLYEVQDGMCALSGMSITLSAHYGIERKGTISEKNKQTASLDRIDSNKGYTTDNVQWVHKTINLIKMDLNQDLFIDICKRIVDKHKHISNTKIIARLNVEGIHRWRKCPIKEVSYLRNYHRHTFYITCYSYVTHSDRDIEFIELTHNIKKYLTKKYFSSEYQCLFFDDSSCEMLAEEILNEFNLYEVEVNEDGEGGSIVRSV